jgi:N,N'-diacetyl-8-epilegionaminate cytidylyltransferase
MASDRIRAFIFARGGSKGVPGKNTKLLAGKPLIAYAIDCALSCPSLGRVSVSTDDEHIADVARGFCADVPFMRPDHLATDTASEWLAWRHAIQYCHDAGDPFDIMVSLPTTSPFRSVDDVEGCIQLLRENPEADVALTVRAAERSPYFNMVQLDDAGRAEIVIKSDGSIRRRQDVPAVYDITTVAYAVRTKFVMSRDGLFDGLVYPVEVPAERALDIDTPYDFLIAELLANHWFGPGEKA